MDWELIVSGIGWLLCNVITMTVPDEKLGPFKGVINFVCLNWGKAKNAPQQ